MKVFIVMHDCDLGSGFIVDSVHLTKKGAVKQCREISKENEYKIVLDNRRNFKHCLNEFKEFVVCYISEHSLE